MDRQEFSRLRQRFNNYVDSFRDVDAKLHPMMELKLQHSLRVADEARGIASDLGWAESEVILAEAVGLFHDVGRFLQYQKYQTYYDPKSVNHGCLGFQILTDSDWLNTVTGAEKTIVLESVRLHNVHSLPADLPAELKKFVDLVRDADKLDIYHVVNSAFDKQDLKENPGIMWNMPRDFSPDSIILKDLRARRQASYLDVKSQADFCLLQLCWIYDLNYQPALRRIHERNIVDRLAGRLPENDLLAQAISELKDFVKNSVVAGNGS